MDAAQTTSATTAALGEAERRYAAANPRSAALFARAQTTMPGGNTRTALHFEPFPLAVGTSAGAQIQDLDGHVYLDVLGEYSAGLFGHSPAPVFEAARAALDAGIANGAPGLGEVELAELLCARFPGIDRLRFCNSGTEANLYALTLARIATDRTAFVGFSGAYHGGVLSLAEAGNRMNVPLDWRVLRYNDIAAAEAAFARAGPAIAAVIVEPMMSNGGCLPATRSFLMALRDLCDRHGAVLIFDEVVTARMGSGGMQGRLGITPDLTTLGKFIGGGFPLAAFGGRSALMDLLSPSHAARLSHAGTFNNHVVSTGAGAAALREIFTPARAERFFAEGERLRGRLNDRAAATGRAVQFTGCGSAMNIHFVSGPLAAPQDLSDEPKDLFRLFHFDMMACGVYPARRGQINLSLPMGKPELATLEAAVGAFLDRRRDLMRTIPSSG